MLMAMTIAIAAASTDAATLKKRGFDVLEQIRREYYLPESKLYAEEIDRDGKKSGPCFNWGTGVMLSALNAAAKLDPKYKPWLKEYADASRIYWNDKGPVPGYDVLPCPKPVDRYYDDNAWMVLALVETYEILGDRKYLQWAEESLTYVLSGWDEKLGGGIYWRESDKASKNTCSNGPSAAACLRVADHEDLDSYLGSAQKILRWTEKNLRDPADGLYWDNVDLNGKIEKTKWTYNTGLMLYSNAKLGKDQKDLVQASLKHWIDSSTGAAKDGGKFVHLWFEGLAEAAKGDKEVRAKMVRALDYMYANARSPEGRFADRWDRKIRPDQAKYALIDQASVVRALLFAAEK